MMQDGLHIGLAAWINAQRNTGGFAVFPAMPIVTTPINLEAAQNPNDIARAAEFARLVNFVPRQGQVADTFSTSTVLWNLHLETLGHMDFATAAWTQAEKAQFEAARSVLYSNDAAGLPLPSDRHLLYLEMKNAYEDLQNTGGSADELTLAMANWITLGYKQIVEDALETTIRLGVRSNLTRTENERISLQRTLDTSGIQPPIAPTYFAPISATAPETWMEAKVSFDNLDQAVGSGPESARWKAYRANRFGEVSFKYAVLNCLRPWFTPALYSADDWRLREGDPNVSQGNGMEGRLPAYVSSVYLVKVLNVTIQPPPARPTIPIVLATTVAMRPVLQVATAPKDVGAYSPKKGEVSKAMREPLAGARVEMEERVAVRRPMNVLHTAETVPFLTARNLGQVQMVTAANLNQRYLVAQEYLVDRNRPRPAPSEPPPELQIYVAGFGCEKIPFSPNPNPNYQW